MLRVRSLAVGAVLLTLAAAACGSTAPPAATVEGDEIGQEDLDGYLVEQGFVEPASRQDIARVLSERIWIDLFEQELERRGVEVPADGDPAAPGERIGLLIRLIAADESGLSAESPVDDVAALVDQDLLPVCSAHILVASEPEAQEVLDRIAAGEDFAELAAELSIDQQSAVEGGSLGCVAPASFVPEFGDALVSLGDGEFSEVVETQFGFHVLQREGVDLTATTSEVLFDTYASELAVGLLRDADVSVLERLGEWNPESDPPQVIVRL